MPANYEVHLNVGFVRDWAEKRVPSDLTGFHNDLVRVTVEAAELGAATAQGSVSKYTGTLANSIRVYAPIIRDTKKSFIVTQDVGTTQAYARPVEHGRSPNRANPPYDVIRRWVHLKWRRGQLAPHWMLRPRKTSKKLGKGRTHAPVGIEKTIDRAAFLIMRKIGRDGILGQGFLARGFGVSETYFNREITNVANQWLKRMGGP